MTPQAGEGQQRHKRQGLDALSIILTACSNIVDPIRNLLASPLRAAPSIDYGCALERSDVCAFLLYIYGTVVTEDAVRPAFVLSIGRCYAKTRTDTSSRIRVNFMRLDTLCLFGLWLALSGTMRAEAQAGITARDLGGTSWQLVKFQGSDGRTLTPGDKSKYTIRA